MKNNSELLYWHARFQIAKTEWERISALRDDEFENKEKILRKLEDELAVLALAIMIGNADLV